MFRLRIGLLLVITFFAFVAFPVAAFAQTPTREQKIVTLNKNQTINHDYFAAGDQVTINGTIDGDAYIAGGKVDINGTIKGDLLVAGGQVMVRGNVEHNVRGVGGNITILGIVGRNVSLLGGNLTLEPNAKIAGNAVIAGGNIDILSQVNDLTVAGGNVQIVSRITGNVTAGTGSLTVGEGANIQGDLSYWSENKATIGKDSSIAGKTTFHATTAPHKAKEVSTSAAKILAVLGMFFLVVSFLASCILGLLIISVFPIYTRKTTSLIMDRFGTSMLVGLGAFILIPILSFVLMITLVGFPVGLITIFAYFIILYLSKIFASIVIGMYIAKVAKFQITPVWALILGLPLYYIVGFIPVVGFLLQTVATLVGMGAIILQKKYYIVTLRTKKLI